MGSDTNTIEIPTPNGNAVCIAFEADRYHLLYGNSSGSIYQYKFETGVAINASVMNVGDTVHAVAASMDGQWLTSSGQGGGVAIWSTNTKKIAKESPQYYGGYTCAIDVSSDSKRVASSRLQTQTTWPSVVNNSTVTIIDITTAAQVAYIDAEWKGKTVVGVKFSPDCNQIATVTYQFASVRVFDAHSGKQLCEIPVQVESLSTTPLAWSSDGQQLFIGSPGKITCLDMATSFYSDWPIQNSEKNVSIVSHGRFIACSAGSSVSFWDYTTREQIGSIVNDNSPINCIAISYGGRYLACGRTRAIMVHDLGDILPSDYLQVPLVSPTSLVQVSNAVLTSWTLGNSADTERMLSEEIVKHARGRHHAHAARSLVRARMKEWRSALEDAETSLKIEPSPLGQIAKALALVGAGKLDDALHGFDLVFHLGSDRGDILFLLVIKSILLFISGKHPQAISRLRELIDLADEKTKDHYMQVLAYMYLKIMDYEHAVQTLELAKIPPPCKHANPLMTISIIFNWKFDNIRAIAWECLCQSLYATTSVKVVGERLLTMVKALAEDEKEAAHGRVLEAIITRSRQVTLLEWTGKSSTCNSCLPSSPTVYVHDRRAFLSLDEDELTERTDELRTVFSLVEAVMIYGRITRLQPVLFTQFRLQLPCIVFGIRSLVKTKGNVYRARTTELGEVKFTTADVLPLKEPRRLVFADLRLHTLVEPHSEAACEYEPESNSGAGMGNEAGPVDAAHGPIIEEVPSASAPVDAYTRALELIAHLGQSFSPLLFLRQSDGTFRRVAADNEIVVRGTGNDFPKDVRVEVLEIR